MSKKNFANPVVLVQKLAELISSAALGIISFVTGNFVIVFIVGAIAIYFAGDALFGKR